MTNAQIGEKLRKAREEAGMSREKLSKKVGYSVSTVVNVEGGVSPTQKSVRAIASALKVDLPEEAVSALPPGLGRRSAPVVAKKKPVAAKVSTAKKSPASAIKLPADRDVQAFANAEALWDYLSQQTGIVQVAYFSAANMIFVIKTVKTPKA